MSDDLAEIGLDITEKDIAIMSKQQFHTIIKTRVRSAALEYLKKLQQKHSKMDRLKYPKLELQPYLSGQMFNNESQNLLLMESRVS